MPNRVNYEWDMEELDPSDPLDATDDEREIIDHNHAEKLSALGFPTDRNRRLVLVRDERDECDQGDRLWAYVDESRMLPRNFSNSEGKETMVAVPQRFHREIARAAARKH